MNIDKQEKTKVGVQIVARRWQGKAAAQPSFLSNASGGTNSNNEKNIFMRTPRHFFSRVIWILDSLYFNNYFRGQPFTVVT